MIEVHILPYFESKPMNAITPSDIIQWQNAMREKGYAQTYLRMVQNQLTALFTHASNIYNLANNPCKKVKKMGKSDADKLDFWTKEEYDRFISGIEEGSRYYPKKDRLSLRTCILRLSDSRYDELMDEIGDVIEKYQGLNEGGKERNLSIISAPVDA